MRMTDDEAHSRVRFTACAPTATPLAALVGSTPSRQLLPASLVGRLVDDRPIAAIVAARSAGDGVTRLEPASPSAVLRALAAQLTGDAARRRDEFHRLGDLVQRVSGWTLHLGHDHESARGTA